MFMKIKLLILGLLMSSLCWGQEDLWWLVDQGILCDDSTQYNGGKTYPTTITINLGTGTGDVYIWFKASIVPDNFYVYYDGEMVFGSGYRSQCLYYSYNSKEDSPGVWRYEFKNALEGRVDPQWGTTYPDSTHYPWDGYPQVYQPDSNTNWAFYKSSSTPTTAIVKVYAPMTETLWWFTLYCPE